MTLYPHFVTLTLHTAVDHVHGQGSGIGVVQQVEHKAMGNGRHLQRLLYQQRRYGYTPSGLADQNIKTSWRAKALALIHALSLARQTVKQTHPDLIHIQKILVFADPAARNVAQAIHDAQRNPDDLHLLQPVKDRRMVRKVIDRIRKMTRRGLEVLIVMPDGESEAGRRAMTVARQRGSKACRSRRQQPRESSGGGDEHASGPPQGKIEIAVDEL